MTMAMTTSALRSSSQFAPAHAAARRSVAGSENSWLTLSRPVCTAEATLPGSTRPRNGPRFSSPAILPANRPTTTERRSAGRTASMAATMHSAAAAAPTTAAPRSPPATASSNAAGSSNARTTADSAPLAPRAAAPLTGSNPARPIALSTVARAAVVPPGSARPSALPTNVVRCTSQRSAGSAKKRSTSSTSSP